MVCSPPILVLVCCSLLPLLHCCASSCAHSTQHLCIQRCSVDSVMLYRWIVAQNSASLRASRLLGRFYRYLYLVQVSACSPSSRWQHSCQSRVMRACSWRKVNGDRGCADRSELSWKHPRCARCTKTVSTLVIGLWSQHKHFCGAQLTHKVKFPVGGFVRYSSTCVVAWNMRFTVLTWSRFYVPDAETCWFACIHTSKQDAPLS